MNRPFSMLKGNNSGLLSGEQLQYKDCESCEYCSNRIPPFESP
jgi:hypothetical protein